MNFSKVSIRVDGDAVLHRVFGTKLPSSSKKRRKKYRIGRCVKGGNSKDGRQGATSLNLPIPGSTEQNFLDAVGISAARSSTVHNIQDAADLPIDEYTNNTANHEKLLRKKVQYRDWELNTQDENIDELTMEFMTNKEKEHIFLDME